MLVDGYAYGSLSMACYGLGVRVPPVARRDDPAAPLGEGAPPESANV